jgi:hypothetical protein
MVARVERGIVRMRRVQRGRRAARGERAAQPDVVDRLIRLGRRARRPEAAREGARRLGAVDGRVRGAVAGLPQSVAERRLTGAEDSQAGAGDRVVSVPEASTS